MTLKTSPKVSAGLWKVFRSKLDEGDDGANAMDSAKNSPDTAAYLVTKILSLASITVAPPISVVWTLPAVVLGWHISHAKQRKVWHLRVGVRGAQSASPIRFPPTVALTLVVAN